MEVKFKKLVAEATIPTYATEGDAGLDFTAISAAPDEYGNMVYTTGIAMEIPYGYVGLLFARGSVAKKDLILSNAVGVVDAGYRGDITFKFHQFQSESVKVYSPGERIGQMIIMPFPEIQLLEVDALSASVRGTGSYGHTGN